MKTIWRLWLHHTGIHQTGMCRIPLPQRHPTLGPPSLAFQSPNRQDASDGGSSGRNLLCLKVTVASVVNLQLKQYCQHSADDYTVRKLRRSVL